MKECCGVKILDLNQLDILTGTEYLLVAYKDDSYKVPINQLATLFSDSTPTDPELYNTLLALFNAFKGDLSNSFNELRVTLTNDLKSFREAVNAKINDCRISCTNKFNELTEQVTSVTNLFNTLKLYVQDTLDSFNNLPNDSDGSIDSDLFNTYLLQVLRLIQALSTTVSSTDTRLTTEMDALKLRVELLNDTLTEEDTRLDNAITAEVTSREEAIEEVKELIESTKAALEEKLNDLGSAQITAMKEQLNSVSSKLDQHVTNYDNPHKVTKALIGLSNVDNTSDEDNSSANLGIIDSAISEAVDKLKEEYDLKFEDMDNKIDGSLGASSQVGDEIEALTTKVDDVSDKVDKLTNDFNDLSGKVDTLEGRVGTVETRLKEVKGKLDKHIQDKNNPHEVTRDKVGLGESATVMFSKLYAPNGFFKENKS